MIDQSTLVNFISVITGFSIIGGIVDALTASYRAESQFSTKRTNYFEVLSVFYHGFYNRLLPGAPLSKKYLFRSFTLSTVFFFAIYSLTCWLNDIEQKTIVGAWSFQLTLFIVYTAIFWLVSAQTKLFISESLATHSQLSRAVFVLSDILASSNIFVFLFSGGLLVAANVFALIVLNPLSSDSKTSVQIAIDKQPSTSALEFLAGNEAYRYSVEVIPLVNDQEIQTLYTRTRFTLYSTRKYLEPRIFLPEDAETTEWRGTSKSLAGLVTPENGAFRAEVTANERFSYSHEYVHPPRSYFLPFVYYANAYKIVDKVEDGFWELFETHQLFGFPNPLYSAFGGFSPFDFEQYCVIKGTTILISAQPNAAIECAKDLFIVSGTKIVPRNYKNAAIYDELQFPFPISAYFVSCMALSLIFYGAVVCTYILLLIRSTPAVSWALRNAYDTVPFTLAGLILGTIIWFLFVST